MSVNEHEMQIINKAFDDLISREAVCEIINDIRDCISVEGYCAILERLKKLPSVRPQEPKRRDCVSRDYLLSIANKDGAYGYVSAHEIINAPPVRPQEQTGHWIHIINDKWKCSRCENIILTEGSWEKPEDRYCKECGAKMVEPQESEDMA